MEIGLSVNLIEISLSVNLIEISLSVNLKEIDLSMYLESKEECHENPYFSVVLFS